MSDRAFTWLLVALILLLTVNAVLTILIMGVVLDTREVMEPLRNLQP